MHREIDRTVDERLFDLLGEQSLAAGIRQRAVLDGVARGADHAKGDRAGGPAMRGSEAVAHLPGLRQRQRAAARADAQEGRNARGLHPSTSQCYADCRRRGAIL